MLSRTGTENGKVFAEHKDKLLIVDGEIRKGHVFSIPETEVDLMAIKNSISIYRKIL